MRRSRASPPDRETSSGESGHRDAASTRAARQREAARAAAGGRATASCRRRRPRGLAAPPVSFPGRGPTGFPPSRARATASAPATSSPPAAVRRPSAAFRRALTRVNTRGGAAGERTRAARVQGESGLIGAGSGTPAGRTPAPSPRRINRAARRTLASGASRTASRGRRADPSRPGGGRCPCCGGSRSGDRKARCPPTARGP